MLRLPSPILAQTVYRQPMSFIMSLRLLNKAMNEKISVSEEFWHQVAFLRGIPHDKYQRAIERVQGILYAYEKKSRLYRLLDNISRDRNIQGPFQQNLMTAWSYTYHRKYYMRLKTLLNKFISDYRVLYHNSAFDVVASYVNPAAFESSLDLIHDSCAQFDIVEVCLDRDYPVFYMITIDEDDRKVASSLIPVRNSSRVILHHSIVELFLRRIFILNCEQPLTRRVLDDLYVGSVQIDGFMVRYTLAEPVIFGESSDPIAYVHGIPLHYNVTRSPYVDVWEDSSFDEC